MTQHSPTLTVESGVVGFDEETERLRDLIQLREDTAGESCNGNDRLHGVDGRDVAGFPIFQPKPRVLSV